MRMTCNIHNIQVIQQNTIIHQSVSNKIVQKRVNTKLTSNICTNQQFHTQIAETNYRSENNIALTITISITEQISNELGRVCDTVRNISNEWKQTHSQISNLESVVNRANCVSNTKNRQYWPSKRIDVESSWVSTPTTMKPWNNASCRRSTVDRNRSSVFPSTAIKS